MERYYHAVVFIGSLVALVVLGTVLYCVRGYFDIFAKEFLVLSVVLTGCTVCLLIYGSYQFGSWLNAKVNRAVNHERLIINGTHSFYLNDEGGVYHTGAIQESAKISAYALSLDSSQRELQEAKGRTPNDLAEDSMSHKVQNLLSQGQSERAIAKALTITRAEVRKLKGL